jgi:hypothetical protein
MSDPGIVDWYLGEIAGCRTLNQFNRVHIHIAVYFTPAETCEIIEGVRKRGIPLAPEARQWHEKTEQQLRAGGRRVMPFERSMIAPGAMMYAAPGTPEERARRTLVIAFTGNAHRLGMPLATFLQHCPAEDYEFVVLFDRARRFYLAGIQGLGADLPSSIDAIRARVDPSRYRRAISFGTSGGGLATVWAGVQLGLPRAVSVGGSTPEEIAGREGIRDVDLSGFAHVIRRHAGRLPELVYVAGELATRDLGKGRNLQQYLPTKMFVVPGCDGHNVLFQVYLQGGLDGLLATLLDERPIGEDRRAGAAA